VVRSRFVVLSVGLVGVLVGACTRDNPAFGDEGTDGGKDDDATDPSADDDDDDEVGDDAVDDEGSEVETSNVDDGQDTGVVDEGSSTEGPSSTSGGVVCGESPPVTFDVKVMDSNDDPVDPVCGAARAWGGTVLTAAENELTVEVCPVDGCDCMGLEQPTTFVFENLAPTPVDALPTPEACITLTVARFGVDGDCGVDWIAVEDGDGSAEVPLYLAASSDTPGWGLATPTPGFGAPFDTCEMQACDDMPVGDWTMLFDSVELAPSESGPLGMDPYGNGNTAPYEITNVYSRIDSDCNHWLGWAAQLL
jgi:hypothetical protein